MYSLCHFHPMTLRLSYEKDMKRKVITFMWVFSWTHMPFSNKQTIKIDMWKDFEDFFTMCSLFLEIEIKKNKKNLWGF